MSITILPSLSSKLEGAHQILETVVLRTNEGAVFTISIGKSVFSDEGVTEGKSFGAKVTLMTKPEAHIGICEGETIEQVSTAAQELIASALLSGKVAASQSVIPRPHISTAPKVHT